jgi:hypothetical protein
MYLIIPEITILGLLLWGCTATPDIPGFDEAAFRQDAGGCEGIRNGMQEQIFAIEDEIRGLSQRQVMNVLGRPDKHELASRGQKSFVYYIEPSPACEQNSTSVPLTMLVRFSALDAVTEVSFENY